MKCNRCSYTWESRVKDPKACPRCKSRMDFIPKQIKTIKNPQVEVQ